MMTYLGNAPIMAGLVPAATPSRLERSKDVDVRHKAA